MHEHPEILGKAGLAEWDAATKGKHLPERKSSMKHPHHGYTHTEVRHHHDGSHTVTHHHVEPEKTVEHAVPDLAGVKDSLEAHLGEGAGEPGAYQAPSPMGASSGA